MSLFPFLLAASLAGTAVACSDSQMSGSSGKKPAYEKTGTATTTRTSTGTTPHETGDAEGTRPPSTATTTTTTTSISDGTDVGVAIPPTGTSVSTTPDEVVDGQEVITDCRRCVARAKELSPQAGFTADIARTRNMHFYKVDPSRNLCDIHFMRNMSDPIADHDGRDSVLENQVALYCPCNCGWAADGESDDDFRP